MNTTDNTTSAAASARDPYSAEDWAKLVTFAHTPFEVWTEGGDDWHPPTNKEWAALANPHLVNIRIAFKTLQKDRDGLRGLVLSLCNMPGNALEDIVADLGDTCEFFEMMIKLIDGANARITLGSALVEMDLARQEGRAPS